MIHKPRLNPSPGDNDVRLTKSVVIRPANATTNSDASVNAHARKIINSIASGRNAKAANAAMNNTRTVRIGHSSGLVIQLI